MGLVEVAILLCFAGVFVTFLLGMIGFVLWLRRGDRGGSAASFLLGFPVTATVGEVRGRRRGPMSSKAVVHRIGSPEAPGVGVELVHWSFVSYRRTPLCLSRDDAHRLAALIERARAAS